MVGWTNSGMKSLLPRLRAAGLAASTTCAAPDGGSNSKTCDFLRKYRFRPSPVVRLSDPARDGGVRPFRDLGRRTAGKSFFVSDKREPLPRSFPLFAAQPLKRELSGDQ